MQTVNTTDEWKTVGDNSDINRDLNLKSMNNLLEDPAHVIGLTHKIVTCSATILTFMAVVFSLRAISKSPMLPVNRHFLYSLSFSDLLQAGVVLPLSMTLAISEDWDCLPPYGWLFQISLSIHLLLTGLYSLAFVNVDHYIAVTESSHYLHQLGPRKSACWVIFIWILGLSYCFPLFLIGPEWAVLCSSNLMFCVINHKQIAAYSITALIILLPPPIVIFASTGFRGLFPHPDDTYKTSVERIVMFRANTAAGIDLILLDMLVSSDVEVTEELSTIILIDHS
ncbi:trace amine-associated receptor 4-like [Watersipora subatra]|uniref:trace amine-associated receptor 4-like n=1 Tax=Watersipora subatra TaxID=2589382 RepID=UPI00355C0343